MRRRRRDRTPLAAGQLRSQLLLGLRATYRVRAVEGEHVVVEAVRVPNLAAGTVLRLRRDAVEAMAVVEAAASEAETVDAELQAALRHWAA